MPCRRCRTRSCLSTARVTYSPGIRSEGIDHVEKACFSVSAGSASVGRSGRGAGTFSRCAAADNPLWCADRHRGRQKGRRRSSSQVAKAGSPPDAIAIVDHGGFLIYFERMDNTQLGSVEIAIAKARSAALFRRPSKVFEDALAGGGAN